MMSKESWKRTWEISWPVGKSFVRSWAGNLKEFFFDFNRISDTPFAMKALVYHGVGKLKWEERKTPILQAPTDAIVRIHKTTICGTDLHIMKGNVPTCSEGTTLGHEGVGFIEEIGTGVTQFKVGDKVLVLDEGLAMLRRICPDMPPNHHGVVSEVWDDGTLLILFDDEQAAPYQPNMVRHRTG